MAAETAESLAVISHRLGSIEASLAAMTAKLDPVVVEREVEKLRLAEVARRQARRRTASSGPARSSRRSSAR